MNKLVSLGELLMRLSCENSIRFSQVGNFNIDYGGSEANVLITASNFGLNTEFLSVLPDNDLGKAALSDLRNNKVSLNHIKFQGDRLGLYFLEAGAINRPGKVIYDRGNSAFSAIDPEWFNWGKFSKIVIGFTGPGLHRRSQQMLRRLFYMRSSWLKAKELKFLVTLITGVISGSTKMQIPKKP